MRVQFIYKLMSNLVQCLDINYNVSQNGLLLKWFLDRFPVHWESYFRKWQNKNYQKKKFGFAGPAVQFWLSIESQIWLQYLVTQQMLTKSKCKIKTLDLGSILAQKSFVRRFFNLKLSLQILADLLNFSSIADFISVNIKGWNFTSKQGIFRNVVWKCCLCNAIACCMKQHDPKFNSKCSLV